jgi:hypothetical protein
MAASTEETRVSLSTAAKFCYAAPANEAIFDEHSKVLFRRCPLLEAFAKSLTEMPVERLGEGVEWLDLKEGIDFDSSQNSTGLITRTHSRGVSAAVLTRTEKLRMSMSFIIGSPGIGKTRTLTFLLGQLLRKDTVNVQYFHQKGSEAMLFLRRRGLTHAYRSVVDVADKAHGTLFARRSSDMVTESQTEHVKTYILLDPSEYGASFAHPFSSHLIVSCSANSKHYYNIHKEKTARRYYLGLPSTREMEIMATKLSPTLDKRVLLSRINDVGPVPRYVFDEDAYKERKEDIDTKSQDTAVDSDLVLTALTRGSAIAANPTICGALFAHLNVEEVDSTTGHASTNYSVQRVSVLSQRAGWLLYQRFRGAFVQATIDGHDCDTRAIFEKLCAFDLIVGGMFSVSDMRLKKRKKSVKYIPPASSVIRVKPSRTEKETRTVFVQPALLGGESISADYDVSDTFEPKQKKKKLGGPFIILSDGYSSIDFLNTTRQVFQATMGSNHDMKGWVELLLDAKILSLDNKEMLSINPEAAKLEFYWVVPKHQSGWETKKEKLPGKDDIPNKFLKQKDIIDKAIAEHVHQFVLFIEKEQPIHSEFWSNFVPMRGGGAYCLMM